MKKFVYALGLAVATVAPAALMAQAIIVGQPNANAVRSGTPITLRIIEGLTTKDKVAKVNDRVRMEVAEAVKVGDVTVIPAGAVATGELTQVKYKGGWGKSGFIAGRAISVDVGGRTVRLSGAFDSKGKSGGVAAVAVSAIVFAPAGFFMTGKSAEMAPGTIIRAYIDEDITFQVAGR